ncbi:MAG: ATP-binding protein [Ktedonobacterales bacterium]
MGTDRYGDAFGDALVQLRKAAGLTQEELAERAHLSRNAISALERGSRRSPRKDTVRLLAAALGLSSEEQSGLLAAARRERLIAGSPFPTTNATAQQELPPTDLPLPPTNLPLPPTPLVGREQELAQAVELLCQDGVRLLTLTGLGGVGKTRLALEVARTLRSRFPDGDFFMSLAALTDSHLVADAISAALGLREKANEPISTTLTAFLAKKRILLLLDNFEQLLDAAPLLSSLLAACTGLKLLVTSRAPLLLRSEHVLPVPLLAVPQGELLAQDAELADLAAVPAVELFLHRAQTARPGFRLSADNASAIAAICRRLDGVPLALELAAPWISVLSPKALLRRLDRPLVVLVSDGYDLPERQQTLRLTIQWSYDLLGNDERALFRRLAVFVEGGSLEAVEAVSIPGDRHWTSERLLQALRSLVQKNLVVGGFAQPDEEPRFSMLDTVRDYAREQLGERGELESARRRHFRHFLQWAESAEPALRGPDQPAWLARMEQEHANLRAALQWALAEHEAEAGLRLGAALWRFWYLHAHFTDGRHWLEQLLAEAGSPNSPESNEPKLVAGTTVAEKESGAARAKVLAGAGILAYQQGDYQRAAALLQQATEIARGLQDQWLLAATLNDHGNVFYDQGDYSKALAFYDESLGLYRSLGDSWGIACLLGNMAGVFQEQGKYGRATGLVAESLALYSEIGDRRNIANAKNGLGTILGLEGDYQRGVSLCREALELSRELDDSWGSACALQSLGNLAFWQGEKSRQAATFLEESLRCFRRVGDPQNTVMCLIGLGNISRASADFDLARRYLNEGLEIARGIGSRRGVAGAMASLGDLWLSQRDIESASRCYQESMGVFRDLGSPEGIARCLDGLAAIRAAEEQLEYAAQLVGAASGIRRAVGIAVHPVDLPRRQEFLVGLRSQLGEERFESVSRAGATDLVEQFMRTAYFHIEE